jgi:hypothetical protein
MKPCKQLLIRRATCFQAPVAAAIIAVVLLAAGTTQGSAEEPQKSDGPVKVEIHKSSGGRYQLYVDNKLFYIKGAGIEYGSQEKLKEHGGNSFRTWTTDNGRESGQRVLDRALTNSLYVAMGLDVDHERRGFDYNNTAAVARQFAALTALVNEYKDHPALIIWVVGNELNFEKNPKVWDAVNDLSKMIHKIDSNHLTTTALAGFNLDTVNLVKTRAPDLDFLSFQMYSDIVNLPKYLREAAWDKPYIVTEWGGTGHWECGKTTWGAPIENDSTTKADLYKMRYEKAIQSDQKLCLGSYVFLWGNKQERTPTWYGMFLDTGEETAPVDVMHYLWTGSWPTNRCPRLEGIWLDGKTAYQSVRLKTGQTYTAKVQASDPDQDLLTYSWEVMEESGERTMGGDVESVPRRLSGLIEDSKKSEITLKPPTQPGAYRLFVYVFDGKGHAAHANIPFYVDPPTENSAKAATNTWPYKFNGA